MGLSASQAQLLALTARLHDVEFEAQSILRAKLKLADCEDAAYEKYLAALDATQITGSVMSGTNTAQVFATYKNLSGGWENMILNDSGTIAYGLVNQDSGYLYVDESMYNAYHEYKGNDSDEFALKRLGYSTDEINAYVKHRDTKGTFYPMENTSETSAATRIIEVNSSSDTYNPSGRYYVKKEDGKGYTEVKSMSEYLSTDAEGNQKFNSNAGKLYTEMSPEDTRTASAVVVDVYKMRNELVSSEGQYYKNTFEMIKNRGGCQVLEKEYQNNSEWLTSMVGYGKVGIYTLSEDVSAERGYKMQQTSTSTSTILCDTSVTSMDNTELKRAEAEYNKELKDLSKKDTQFDLALEDLETERTAITTEIESVRTVIDDNIKRTFGIFG